MRRLLLLRHGKAARKDGRFDDFDRPLTVDGWEEVRRIGRLVAEEFPPDLIVASSSRRTRETLAAVLGFLANEVECRLDRALYDADVESLLDFTREAENAETLMLVGHNPGFEEALRYLSWPGDPAATAAASGGLRTGALAVFEYDVGSWRDARPGEARLVLVQSPRDLRATEPVPKD